MESLVGIPSFSETQIFLQKVIAELAQTIDEPRWIFPDFSSWQSGPEGHSMRHDVWLDGFLCVHTLLIDL